jgi:hypothetical protein
MPAGCYNQTSRYKSTESSTQQWGIVATKLQEKYKAMMQPIYQKYCFWSYYDSVTSSTKKQTFFLYVARLPL